ncbi:MAG: hypothetical protein WD801_02885 [Gemmatimonadaceae bacterium]
MTHTTRYLGVAALLSLAACDTAAVARGDSLQAVLTEQQTLALQLASQKDSLTRVVLDADAFLGEMDSAIKTVRGLPAARRASTEGPLQDQVSARKEMMGRVDALVARAKNTATQLATVQKQRAESEVANVELRAQLELQATKTAEDAQMIADLGATIERQRLQIASLEGSIDSLNVQVRTLGTRHYQAYYVVGTEKELMDKGVVVKEGGANLLFMRPGKTLQPARVLDVADFQPVDQRDISEIPMPDSTKRYRVVSRQTLDAAEVDWRDGTQFRGTLKIANKDEFWAPSRFLILVEM